MSEPVTNSEIEDVLSSIRRLISENPSKGEDGDSNAAPTDKLVLTPAFRVLDGDGAGQPASDNAQAAPVLQEVAENSGPPAPRDPETDAVDLSEDTSADDDNPLEQRIAELEAAIGDSFDEWEPDGSEYEEGGEAPTVLYPEAEAPAQWDVVPDEPQGGAQGVINLSSAHIVLEAEEVNDADEPLEEADDEDILLDEAALREMVSNLVREQLKGQIGERITRNIRRMVRREIRQALAVRDID